ncbi:glycoside hydrolase family 28 protein, partial [candidate division KSB1 bacterium]|nr:glycoside hydrolase family 28 protein [candidate division KSB1 bacterium]
MRGPDSLDVGIMQRITLSNIIVNNADPRYGSLIVGIPGHKIKDVQLNNIQIMVKGGAPKEQVAVEVPELEDGYPDPRFFGKIPAYGFFIRHVDGIEFNNVSIRYMEQDFRPAFVLENVQNADFSHVKAQHTPDVPTFLLKNVENFETFRCQSAPDTKLDKVEQKQL